MVRKGRTCDGSSAPLWNAVRPFSAKTKSYEVRADPSICSSIFTRSDPPTSPITTFCRSRPMNAFISGVMTWP
jgi:hypothetical protein